MPGKRKRAPATRSISDLPEFPDQFLLWGALRDLDRDTPHLPSPEQWALELELQASRARDHVFRIDALAGLEGSEALKVVREARRSRKAKAKRERDASPASMDTWADGSALYPLETESPAFETAVERAARDGDSFAALLVDVGKALSLRPSEIGRKKSHTSKARDAWSDLCNAYWNEPDESDSIAHLAGQLATRHVLHGMRDRMWELALELQRAAWCIRPESRRRGRPKDEKIKALCQCAHDAGLSPKALARAAVIVQRWPAGQVEALHDRFRQHWPSGE